MPTKHRRTPGMLLLIVLLLPLSLEAEPAVAPTAPAATAVAREEAVSAPRPDSVPDPASAPSEEPASQVILPLHDALLDVMRHADELGYEGRFAKLEPVVTQAFDVEFMARKSVGRYWKQASPDERQRFLEAFERFMVANYAGQFDAFSGQSFETVGTEPARMDTVLVRCVLIDPSDKNVELNYRLRPLGTTWKIIDVYLDGTVSELALRRSEFSSIVKKDDFAALIAALDEKIAKLASESETS